MPLCLPEDVVGSFEAMRRYLREVKKCLERVDPHLCNNVGLVARLVDWEARDVAGYGLHGKSRIDTV